MEFTVEPASLCSLNDLYEIERKSFKEEAFTRSQIATLLTDCSDYAFVARIEGKTVGFMIATVEIAGKKLAGHILTIDVLPQYRRRGIARALLRTAEMAFRKKGICECRLEVREDNATALNLYLDLGYRKIGRLEKYYGKKHGLYFKKML